MRLKAIAVERAPTIATVIQTICHPVGRPRAASTAPRKANGSANSVCSILIISSVVRTFLTTAAIDSTYAPTVQCLSLCRSTLTRLSNGSRLNAEYQTDREFENKDDPPAPQSFAGDDKNRGSRPQFERPPAKASAYSPDGWHCTASRAGPEPASALLLRSRRPRGESDSFRRLK